MAGPGQQIATADAASAASREKRTDNCKVFSVIVALQPRPPPTVARCPL